MAAIAALHLVAAVAADQLEKAAFAGLHRGHLGAQIAERAARQPHVLADDLDEVGVDLAAILILQDRHLQALGVDVGGHAAERPPMSIQCAMQQEKPTSSPRWKIGKRQRDVVEVAAGDVGIVGDVDVARLHAGEAEVPDLRLDRLRHAADEHRQPDADRHRLRLRREQADGEVERLVDDHVVGGAHQVGLHLVGDGDDAVAHDLGDHGIEGLARLPCALWAGHADQRPFPTAMTRLPQASTVSVSPGISTVVDACSSMSAGPLMRLPAASAARAKVRVGTKPRSRK